MTPHDHAKATLRLWTLGVSPEERKQVLRLEWDAGLVQIHSLDPAYDDFMEGLVRGGCFSNEQGRTLTVDDGFDFLKAVEGSLVNSSYWWSEWA